MIYVFNTKEHGRLSVFHNELFEDGRGNGCVVYHLNENGNSQEYQVSTHDDGYGLYFEIGSEKFFILEHEYYSPEELVRRFGSSEEIHDYNLCQTLMKYGIDCIRFLVNVSPDSGNDPLWIEYGFVEEYLRNPESCYKLMVKPVDEKNRNYPIEDFYVGDLVSLLFSRPDLYKVEVA